MLSEHRRRQILDDDTLDDDTGEARFDTTEPGDTSSPRNGRIQEDTPPQEDSWVNSFMGRLAALVRDVSGRGK
jgi:hypothetical protein